jgi:hypothetical protein
MKTMKRLTERQLEDLDLHCPTCTCNLHAAPAGEVPPAITAAAPQLLRLLDRVLDRADEGAIDQATALVEQLKKLLPSTPAPGFDADVVEEAQEAFWAVVAKYHPEVESGDFLPTEQWAFAVACERAYAHWLDINSDSEEG